MNTIMGVCSECGKVLVLRGANMCWSCKGGYRACVLCGSWGHRERMKQDVELQKPYHVGSEYHGWVCSRCDKKRQKATQ